MNQSIPFSRIPFMQKKNVKNLSFTLSKEHELMISTSTTQRAENWPISKECSVLDEAYFCPQDVRDEVKRFFGNVPLLALARSAAEFKGVLYSEKDYVVACDSDSKNLS